MKKLVALGRKMRRGGYMRRGRCAAYLGVSEKLRYDIRPSAGYHEKSSLVLPQGGPRPLNACATANNGLFLVDALSTKLATNHGN
jgi:hypothetical protein